MNAEDDRLIRVGRSIVGAAGGDFSANIEAVYERLRNPKPLPLCMDKGCQWQATGAHFHGADDAVKSMFGTEVIAFIEDRARQAARRALYDVREGMVARVDSPPANPKTWPSVVFAIIDTVLRGLR